MVRRLGEPGGDDRAAVLVGQVANFPVLALVFPRLLELAGVATVVQAVNKYGGEEGKRRPAPPSGRRRMLNIKTSGRSPRRRAEKKNDS